MMRKRTQTLIFTFVALIFAAVVLILATHSVFYHTSDKTSKQILNHQPLVSNIQFEVATTTIAQERGLSGRASIPNDYAMLFVFNKDKMYGFWMKEMLVPIDIVWLSDSGRIIGIDHSVQPNTYPHIFYPSQPVRYVLEMHSRETFRLGWKIGTKVSLPLPYRKNILH